MAFGQKAGTGRPRGRPPKDPQLRAQYDEQVRGYSSDSKARKIDSFDSPRGSVLDVQLAHQNAEDLDGVLQDLRARYEKGIDDRVSEAVREREAIQAQFDRLKELRVTQSEKTLAEVKKASDARIRRTFPISHRHGRHRERVEAARRARRAPPHRARGARRRGRAERPCEAARGPARGAPARARGSPGRARRTCDAARGAPRVRRRPGNPAPVRRPHRLHRDRGGACRARERLPALPPALFGCQLPRYVALLTQNCNARSKRRSSASARIQHGPPPRPRCATTSSIFPTWTTNATRRCWPRRASRITFCSRSSSIVLSLRISSPRCFKLSGSSYVVIAQRPPRTCACFAWLPPRPCQAEPNNFRVVPYFSRVCCTHLFIRDTSAERRGKKPTLVGPNVEGWCMSEEMLPSL